MKKSFISAFTIILIGLGTAKGQQIPLFNSFTLNKFLINPSYAGINGKTNVYGINRIQYAGFSGAPITYMLTADAGFKDKKFGLGGAVFSDRNNIIAQNGFQLTYAYILKLSDKWTAGMGLNAGMVQWNLNFDKLIMDDPTEDVLSNYSSNSTTFRSDLGFRLNSDKIDFGICIPQLVATKVKYSDYLKNSNGQLSSIPHFIANLSYLFTLNEAIKIKPMVLVRGSKDIKPQIDVIGMVDWKSKAYATLGYRTSYALSIGGGVRLGKGLSIGYTFDKPTNSISAFSMGSHEIMVGITLGERTSEKSEPVNAISKDAETKLKVDLSKQIEENLSKQFEDRLNEELKARVNKAVEDKMAKAIENLPKSTTTPADGATTPATAAISKEDMEKMKKDIEEKIKKQMEESYSKLIDEKIKKAIDGKPAATTSPSATQPNKEDAEKIRKEMEEKLRKELTEKINKTIEESIQKEAQKAKDEALKSPPDYKMTAKDKAALDSLKKQNLENEKRIADLEIALKNFPENDRVENSAMREITRIVHQNDIELKKFKEENKAILDKAADQPAKKANKDETSDEASKFVLVLAGFKTLKEAQQYQQLAAQTFEFPNCKILKPDQIEGWYFVYQKSFGQKKKAWEAYGKIFEAESNTPKYPWVYVIE